MRQQNVFLIFDFIPTQTTHILFLIQMHQQQSFFFRNIIIFQINFPILFPFSPRNRKKAAVQPMARNINAERKMFLMHFFCSLSQSIYTHSNMFQSQDFCFFLFKLIFFKMIKYVYFTSTLASLYLVT